MPESVSNLVAWQKAMDLARSIHRVTLHFPDHEERGMTTQLRRASVSVPSNIAEGRGRGSKRDFCHFLVQARGSLYEVETQVRLATDFKYIEQAQAKHILEDCDEVARLLNGLINSLR